MNRLSPLIVRQVGPHAAPWRYEWDRTPQATTPLLSDDMRLFLSGWFGGLVFFGTFFA